MQIKIHRYFGKEYQKAKLAEEFVELLHEYENFNDYPDLENIIRLIQETEDFSNVLEGIAIVEYGLNMDKFKEGKKNKLVRTLKIIQKCIADEREYEDVRKEFD